MTTFGMIGAGKIGGNVARAVLALGHEVVLSNSRGPATLTGLVDELGPRARAATVEDAAAAGDVVLVAIPFHAFATVPTEPLAGKIVLDANNYYYERDGRFPRLDAGETTSSGLLQEHLADAKVAKAFNHISWVQILTDGAPAGAVGRRALATASDHPDALEFVTALYDGIGFDAVPIAPLSESWRIERDRPGYGRRLDREQLRASLAEATRTI